MFWVGFVLFFFFAREMNQTHSKSVFLIKMLLCYFHHLFCSFHLQTEFPPFSQQIRDFRLKPCSYTAVHSRLTMYVSLIFYYHPWKFCPLFFTGGQWWCQDFLYSQYSSEKTTLPSNQLADLSASLRCPTLFLLSLK